MILLISQLLSIAAFANPQFAVKAVQELDSIFNLQENPRQAFIGIDVQGRLCKVFVEAPSKYVSEVIVRVNLPTTEEVANYIAVISPQEFADSQKVEHVVKRDIRLIIVTKKDADTILDRKKQTLLTVIMDTSGSLYAVNVEYRVGTFFPYTKFRLCEKLVRQ